MNYDGGPMTEAMYYVLLALHSPNHGYQLMADIKRISDNRVEMGPGTLYGVLTRMQKEHLISVVKDDGRRKTYQLTDNGRNALKNEYLRLKNLVIDGKELEEGL